MKRFAFFMLIAAVAAVAACQKQATDEPIVKNGSYVYTVNASIGDADVKSDYDADGKFSWSEGDAISVLFHNGDDNKFFTLTRVSGTGSSASFSGTIDDGYTIGASDGTVSDKKIWALFPASTQHSYVAGDSKPARFYMEPQTDYTAPGAHWSANMPMYDLLTSEGDFSFKNLAAGYKITLTDIDASVTKVKFTVENQNYGSWYQLSGSIKIHAGEVYLDHDYPSSSQYATLSFISNVNADHTAVFYIPFRFYCGGFKPIVTVQDYNTGNLLKTITTTNNAAQITSLGKVQPLTISVPGTGTFVSKFGKSWFTDGSIASTDGDGVNYTVIKATSDASFLYVLLGVKKSMLTINKNYYRANSVNYYFGSKDGYLGYLYKNGVPMLDDAGSAVPDSNVVEAADVVYYEWKCTRKPEKFGASLSTAGSVGIKFCVFYNMYVPESGSSTVEDWSHYAYSPEVTVTFAEDYVAP